jgi:hypothetical protein
VSDYDVGPICPVDELSELGGLPGDPSFPAGGNLQVCLWEGGHSGIPKHYFEAARKELRERRETTINRG